MINYLTATAEEGLQNVYTPLSMKAHFIFCLIATALYLVQFYRRGSWHYLLIMFAVDLTFATQLSFCQTSSVVSILALVEIVLLALALLFYVKFTREKKTVKIEPDDEERKAKCNVEKAQRLEQSRPVDNAFEDEDE
ncbi:MAG: hypothetical protein LUE12_01255 [Ruminococcus sp.]|nr:hypothetical protein [Ruminococcus sp.]